MTLVVRDEEDVVRANLDFHLRRGVDFVLVTDHRSQDATREILDEYAQRGVARVFHEDAEAYEQGAWVTRMARLAATEHGADWVINSDADEFWWPLAGTLKDMLAAVPDAYAALAVPPRNFVPSEGSEPFWERMVLREVRSQNLIGEPLEPTAPHRGRPDIEVDHGNHWVAAPGLRTAPPLPLIEILHYPVRSYEQYERKVVHAGRGFEALENRAPDVGRDVLMMLEVFRQGGLRRHFAGLIPDKADVQAGLRDGRFVVDRRLQRYLSDSPAETEPATEPPTPEALAAAELAHAGLAAIEEIERSVAEIAEARRQEEGVRADRDRLRQELEQTRVSLELLRNSRLIRATRPARLLYHRLRRR